MQSKHKTKATHVGPPERCVEFHLSVVTIERSQMHIGDSGMSVGGYVDDLIHDAMREGKQLRELTIDLSELRS